MTVQYHRHTLIHQAAISLNDVIDTVLRTKHGITNPRIATTVDIQCSADDNHRTAVIEQISLATNGT